MLLRAVVGAGAGVLAGAGFALTLEGFNRYCYLRPGRTGCGVPLPVFYPPVFALWMVVAGVLIWAGFRVARQEREWLATSTGSVLWAVLIVAVVWFKATYLDMYQEDGRRFLVVAAVVVPCVACAVAALAVGRAVKPLVADIAFASAGAAPSRSAPGGTHRVP
ncbi:hypothetical protein AB0M48_12890 [Lentzea sp. NPDC051208]|uniref:hypothetical protein n=1 Tax=Lentzea sp. NPDC051208 TaxID=3154642 RepID=UPI003416AB4A